MFDKVKPKSTAIKIRKKKKLKLSGEAFFPPLHQPENKLHAVRTFEWRNAQQNTQHGFILHLGEIHVETWASGACYIIILFFNLAIGGWMPRLFWLIFAVENTSRLEGARVDILIWNSRSATLGFNPANACSRCLICISGAGQGGG